MSVNTYANYLQQTSAAKDVHSFLFKNIERSPEKASSSLTLREITLLGLKIKEDLIKSPEKAQIVSDELQRMAEQKKIQDQQRSTVNRVLSLARDYWRNYWGGLGLKSSETIAEELSQELAKHKPQPQPPVPKTDTKTEPQVLVPVVSAPPIVSAPIDIPIKHPPESVKPKPFEHQAESPSPSLPASITPPSPSTSPTITTFVSPSTVVKRRTLERTTTNGKSRALDAYKTNPAKCGVMQKNIIFKDIRSIASAGTQEIISVVQLMEYVSGLATYDLRNPMCGRVVGDTLKECNIETSNQLCEWLMTDPTFNPDLLVQCLSILIDKEALRKVVSHFAIENFLKIFAFNSWNQCIEVNHPIIINAMVVLLRNDPNNDRIGVLLDWMIRQPEFSFNSFVKLVRVFKDKEEFFSQKRLFYPACDKLLERFKQTPEWPQRLFVDESYKDVRKDMAGYFHSKGIFASEEEKLIAESTPQPVKESSTSPAIPRNVRNLQQRVEVPRHHHELRRRSTAGKSRALQMYSKSPSECLLGPKSIIFKDIKFIEPPTSQMDDDEIISVVHLMKYMTRLTEIDLTNSVCAQIIVDTLAICDKETNDRLCEWLIKEKTFNPRLLFLCLDVFIEKRRVNSPCSYFALEMLIKKYISSSWNVMENGESSPYSPANSPFFISALVLLLKNAPNDENVGRYIIWAMDQPEFDPPSFCQLLLVFRDKEFELGVPRIFYPNRDKMMARLGEHRVLSIALARDMSAMAEETIDYICLIK